MLNSVHITYDGEGDTLYVSFGDSRGATGYQISDQVLLRMDPDSDEPTGLTIFNFLHHIRSGLGIELDEDEIEGDALEILSSPAIGRFIDIRRGRDGVTAHLLQPSLEESISVSHDTDHVG